VARTVETPADEGMTLFGSLATRRMRPIWGWFAFVLAVAVSTSLLLADEAREDALRRNAAAAEHVAQTELAVLLEPRDLAVPVHGDRAAEIGRGIEARITSTTPIDRVRIYSSLGRILYAKEAGIVGTRPTYLRNLMFEIANGETAVSQIHSGSLQTLVPIWLSPGGPVGVAELSQPFGPIASMATARWYLVALACGALLLGAAGMLVVTSLATPRVALPRTFVAARRTPGRPAIRSDVGPAAEPRATGSLPLTAPSPRQRKELDDALARIAELERRVGAAGDRDAELQVLRAQLRETTEQLDRAELDAGVLRERLALTQRAFDEATARLDGTPGGFAHDDIEIQQGADELSIRRSGGREGSRTTRGSHG
jgi:hypothetical protein